ncbi:hypothetical protein AKJ45_01955 [candidate division MSBL1 archaeon SCGC-AAA261F19]|uniref:Uncharacterized protein n=1 Tax=candidate division MSBL1 archaeon SCGC-AAA261F19 TaxID=1698275 RepID=A0A133VA22_9EURY|nr:hypothetical protein AKJ45_01955 [candidate division MSBL1 archaeon SCGC-AAA261F19]
MSSDLRDLRSPIFMGGKGEKEKEIQGTLGSILRRKGVKMMFSIGIGKEKWRTYNTEKRKWRKILLHTCPCLV